MGVGSIASRLAVAREFCTGCGACASSCSRGGLSLVPDGAGFLYPRLDETKCIGCGTCLERCPLEPLRPRNREVTCFSARTFDETVLMASSSGGVFTELARPVLANGGCVFGCAMVGSRDELSARHVKVDSVSGLAALRGSKYLQSTLGDTFRDCKSELEEGRSVLFSGTPCQIAGLRAYLGRVPENLLTVAVICNGVPSPMVFEKRKREVARRIGGMPTSVAFREKRDGWMGYSVVWRNADSASEFARKSGKSYLRDFDLMLRNCCYDCRFRDGRSGADVLIGDFWGMRKLYPERYDEKGWSVVLAYSPRGLRAVRTAAIERFEIPFADAVVQNPRIVLDSRKKASCARYLKNAGCYPLSLARRLSAHRSRLRCALASLRDFVGTILGVF